MATTTVEPTIDPKVAKKVGEGEIVEWAKLATALAPAPVALPEPSKVALPVALSDEVTEALAKLPEVYGEVVPDTKRKLEDAEVDSLLVERATLKSVEKAIKARVDDISLIVLNHSDVSYSVDGDADGGETMLGADGLPLRNKDGHVIRKVALHGGDPAITTKFSVEARKGSPSIDLAKLKAISEDADADYFTHEDWLAMTSQTRVFDENKAMIQLRKNPKLLRAVAEATKTATPSVAVYQR